MQFIIQEASHCQTSILNIICKFYAMMTK